MGWVQRSDTGEIEGFLLSDITPTPEAYVRVTIGKAYEVMQDERRAATEAFAEALRATGITVDLEIMSASRAASASARLSGPPSLSARRLRPASWPT